MSLSNHTVPYLRGCLGALSSVLNKTQAFATERKIEEAVFLQARLAPDMFPFIRQFQIASDIVRRGVDRLAGNDPSSRIDDEKSFADVQKRIDDTLAGLNEVSAAAIDEGATRTIELKLRGHDLSFSGEVYARSFVLPNVSFHVTTAYAIARHNGVALGKPDFLGPFLMPST